MIHWTSVFSAVLENVCVLLFRHRICYHIMITGWMRAHNSCSCTLGNRLVCIPPNNNNTISNDESVHFVAIHLHSGIIKIHSFTSTKNESRIHDFLLFLPGGKTNIVYICLVFSLRFLQTIIHFTTSHS